jgi:hypothetical protein
METQTIQKALKSLGLVGLLALSSGCGPIARESQDKILYGGVISTNPCEYVTLIQPAGSPWNRKLEISRKGVFITYAFNFKGELYGLEYTRQGSKTESFLKYRNSAEISIAEPLGREYLRKVEALISSDREREIVDFKLKLEGGKQ